MSPRISISLLAAQPDQRLLALVRDGNERAFEALVHRYRRPLLRYCRRMSLSETRAEDVLQQAFLQAWLALARGAEVRELRAWLYRIVHNAAVNAMRGTAESHGELTEAAQDRVALAGESNLERRIAVREALGEVAELPQMQRAAIFLTAVDGQTHEEVAHTLGISHGALRGLLYRARTTLRSAAAALTPSPLLAWGSRGSGAAALSAERFAEAIGGAGGAGLAGALLKGAVVTLTAGALATGAGVIASHGLESAGRRHSARGTTGAIHLAAPVDMRQQRRGVGSAAAGVALVEHRSTRDGRREAGSHGKRSSSGRAQHGGPHREGDSPGGAARGRRGDSSPRQDSGEGGSGGAGGDENAGSSGAHGGSAAALLSTTGGSSGSDGVPSSHGDRHSGSDGSPVPGTAAVPATGEQAPGGSGRGGSAGSSPGSGPDGASAPESSRSDG